MSTHDAPSIGQVEDRGRTTRLTTRHRLGVALAAVALGTVATAPAATAATPTLAPLQAASGQPVSGQYIVVLKTAAPSRSATAGQVKAAKLARTSAVATATRSGGRVLHSYGTVLNGYSAQLSATQLAAVRKDSNVAYVVQDSVVTATATQTGATWGLDRIDQRARPLDSSYTYDTTATNVTAYIIDTGILTTHSQFGGRAVGGFTSINDGRGTSDCSGHGTHVAGTVGGSTYGVAKGVKLVAVRVLNCAGSGTNAGVIAGVDWVTANHTTPAVANMSLGGSANTALDTAVANSIAAGVTYAIAAGNSNANACNASPARLAAAITVGATTSTDARASYSNYGSCLDVFAPGSSITSAWYTSTSATNTISGTSMASPHVAGVAALYLAANPSASPATVRNAIVNGATTGVVTSPGTSSPNRLLYSLL